MTRKEIKDWAKKTAHAIMHGKPRTEEFVCAVGTDVNKTLFAPLLRCIWNFIKGKETELTIRIIKN